MATLTIYNVEFEEGEPLKPYLVSALGTSPHLNIRQM